MDIVEHSEFPQDRELAIIKSISLISECGFFGVMVSDFQLVRWLRFRAVHINCRVNIYRSFAFTKLFFIYH